MRRALLLLPVAIVLALPSTAQAKPASVVTFDSVPAGTALLDQFDTPGTQIQFGHPYRFVQAGKPGDPDGVLPFGDPCPSLDNSGSMSVADGGIVGRSAELGCRRDEIGSQYLGAFHTDVERRSVSFRLRATGLGAGSTVTVQLYGVGGVRLEKVELTLADGVATTFSRLRAEQEIVTVVISAFGNPFSNLVLDDIIMTLDDVPPPPKFEIALGKAGSDIVEGSTLDLPVNLLRYNGSAGAITFTAGAPPPGITAAQVTPNPVTGTSGPKLRITAASPLAGVRQIAVTASGNAGAGIFVGGGKTQTVTGVPALVVAQGVAVPGAQEGVTRGCGQAPAAIGVGVRGDFSGPVDMIVSVESGPVELRGSFERKMAAGNGTLFYSYGLVQPIGARGESVLKVRFRPEGATEVSRSVRVIESALSIASAPPGIYGPEVTNGSGFGIFRGDLITLRGVFPPDCTPTFKDDRGTVIPLVSRRNQVVDYGDDVRLRLPIPVLPTAVRAFGPGEVELARSQRIEVDVFRNFPALQTANSGTDAGDHDFTWSDFLHAFGRDDGEACSPFTCYRDPFALQAFDNIRDKLRTDSGLCFGYATMALLFKDGLTSARDFGWNGSPYTIPFFQGSTIKDEVVRWQVTQYDSDWQDYTEDLKDDIPTPAAFITRLRDLLVAKDEVYITIRTGAGGHAVVAYDLVDKGGGVFDILTYNPNTPYAAGEEAANAAVRTNNVARSTITVGPGSRWSGGIFGPGGGTAAPWMGDMSTIEIIDRLPPNGADLSGTFWTNSLESADGAAKISQVEVGGVKALRADATAVPGTGVDARTTLTGVTDETDYTFARGKSYAVTVTGERVGSYGTGLLGPTTGGRAEGVRTTKGQADVVTVTPGKAEVELESGAGTPATLRLLQRAGGRAVRSAELRLSSREGGGDRAQLTGGAVDLRHAGAPTTVSATLASTGAGAPSSVTTRGLRVGAGQRLALAPVSWTDLGAGVRFTVRARSGVVVRRGSVGLQAARTVRVAGVRARLSRTGGKLRVLLTGRVTKAGGAPLLVGEVRVLRGGRTQSTTRRALRGRTKVKRGRFSLSVPLKSLRPGARVEATVTLADEAAGFASVRRVVRAR